MALNEASKDTAYVLGRLFLQGGSTDGGQSGYKSYNQG